MAGERYKHLDVSSLARPRGFTSRPQRGPESRPPTRDRTQHSDHLRSRLREAWAAFDSQRQAVVQVERDGAYFDFVSEPGHDLLVKSLEHMSQGIRLRNVRTDGEGDEKRTFATVFVPLSKRGVFLKKLNDYSTKETKKGKPLNGPLVASISDIRLAVVESFWPTNELALIPRDNEEWVELWISSERDNGVDRILTLLSTLNIESADGILEFPERAVKLILANRANLEQLIESSDDIAEFRVAKSVASFYIELENRQQLELVQELINRTTFSDVSDVSVCILDTGVNNGHILIQPILDNSDLHTVKPQWGTHDHDKHGTLMAGTVAYGDLLSILNNGDPVFVGYVLESSKILPPPPTTNPKELWGYITSQGISRAEIQAPRRKRIICMAVTSDDDRDRGRPSSWSGAIDELASGYEDDNLRLIIVSAGNVDDSNIWRNYYNGNLTSDVQDPGQAWNALTVGAYTDKVQIRDPVFASYSPIAPQGGLSPFSTTSTTWPAGKWPIKPEVLFEGGNVARDPNDRIEQPDDLKLISTNYQPHVSQLEPFWATSAASAQAAWFAAQIQVEYPELWPETIRALVVHSASWTDMMLSQFLRNNSKTEYARLLRICGYGVPDLGRALYCMADSLTLISQATLQPYDKRDGSYVTRDMHIYTLPWPADILTELGETQVSMRVTLSYFVEPSPGGVGWKDRYRYASHVLRFDMNGPDESENDFVQRINAQARDADDIPRTEGVSGNWTIGGQARNVGSIHSDIWKGQAADLAASNKIAVYPAVGWWRERHHLGRWNKECRYSLLVSIYTPEQEVDIYIPVAIQLGITVPVEIPIRNRE